MGMFINIGVDARQVSNARKEVMDLGSTLTKLNDAEISLGGEGLSKDAEILRQASLDIIRLGNLTRSGESKGGTLNIQQWKDAATLSKRVGDNLGDWIKQSQKLREELKQVNGDLKGLQQASMDPSLNAKHRQMIIDEIGMLSAQKADIEKEINGRGKSDSKAGYLQDRAEEHANNIQGYGSRDDSMQKMQSSMLGKIEKVMVATMALVGGASLLSMVHRSIETYKQRETTGADMGAMGVKDSHASDFLFSERTAAKVDLARSTGYDSTHMLGAAANMARGRFVPLDTMTGFMSSMYKSTGMGEEGITGMTAGIFATTKNTKRQVDVLEGIQKLLAAQAAQQGGPVGKDQAAYLSGLYTSNFEKSVSLQNTSIYEKLNAGIAAGGKNPGEQLLFWKLAGGDKHDGSWKSLNEVRGRMEEGIGNKDFRNNLKQWLTENMQGDEQKVSFLKSVFGLSVRRGGIDKNGVDTRGEGRVAWEDILNSAEGAKKEADNGSKIKELAKKTNTEIIAGAEEGDFKSFYSGSTTRKLALHREDNYATAGEMLGPKIQKLEDGLLRIGTSFLDGIAKIHSVGDALHEAGGFLKKSAKTLWDDSGPFGKMLALLGGIYAVAKAIGMGKTGVNFALGMAETFGVGTQRAATKAVEKGLERGAGKTFEKTAEKEVIKRVGVPVGKALIKGVGATVGVATELAMADPTSKDADIDKQKMMQWEKANPYGSEGRVDSQKGDDNERAAMQREITNKALQDILNYFTSTGNQSSLPVRIGTAKGSPY